MQRISRYFSTGRLNYYEILGVRKDATSAEIKKAFFTLSKKYHPDLTGSNEKSTKKFVEVKEAYDTLRDEEKRRTYDAILSGGYHHGPGFQNPFPGAGFPGEFKQWKSNGWQYTFIRKDGTKFTDEDFQRIWRDFQRKTQHPPHAEYDRMFRERRQKAWDEFSAQREEMWRRKAEEFAKKYPFESPHTNPLYRIPWDRIQKYLGVYVGIFFLLALFQTIYNSGERHYQKSTSRTPPRGQEMTPNEALQQMIYKMPTDGSSQDGQILQDKPLGYPEGPRSY